MNGNKMRKPNKEELEDLKNYFIDLGSDESQAKKNIENYWYVVFEDYITDGPGYSGKVLMALYGCQSFYECFIWVNGKMEKVEIDEQMINKTEA